jgi:hypothetical protein
MSIEDDFMKNENSLEKELICPVCGSSKLWSFYYVSNVPASCNRLWNSPSEAVNCPKGDINLVFCYHCTSISNISVDPNKNRYDKQYDNSLFYSNYFQEFSKQLTLSLIEHYDIRQKFVVTIGGGKVDFQSLFISLGKNECLNFNPFETETPEDPLSSFLLSLKKERRIDFMFSYHELEHMNHAQNFVCSLGKFFRRTNYSTLVFFSVPNALKAFEEGDYSDIIYEHVWYFTLPSIHYLFSSCGFDVLCTEESKGEIFDSIYITAAPNNGSPRNPEIKLEPEVTRIKQAISQFNNRTIKNINKLKDLIENLLESGNKVVVWGAGARGVTFLNILKEQRISYVIDINPNKHGKFIPGTGQEIVKPEFLVEYKPDYIFLANPAYKREIKHMLEDLKVKVKLISV